MSAVIRFSESGHAPRRRPLVWVAQGVWFEDVLRGISRYANEHDWDLDTSLRFSRGPVEPPKTKPDGVIVFTLNTPGLEEAVKSLGVPTVDMEDYSDLYGAPKVLGDDREVGRMAARHLIASNPVRLFAVFNNPAHPVSAPRVAGFLAMAKEAGFPAEVIRAADCDPVALVKNGPAGLYAGGESIAHAVLRRAIDAGVRIPEQLAILSGDDFGTVCATATVPISSIDLNMERKGYAAARLLDRILLGLKPSSKPVIVPPSGVTERESTRMVRSGNERLDRLVRHLRDNCHRRAGLDLLCEECGIPLRTAQHLVKTRMATTPGKLMTRFRLEAAEKIERAGPIKKDSLARAVGFGGRSGLSRARSEKRRAGPGDA